jgi:hypothetical protein
MISTHIIKEDPRKTSAILNKFYNYLVITYLLENNKIKREKSNVGKAALKILPNYQDFIDNGDVQVNLGVPLFFISYRNCFIEWDNKNNKYS